MRHNLLEDFGDWLKNNLGMDTEDFADISDVILAGKHTMKPDGDGEPIEYPGGSRFKVSVNPAGTTYKLTDINEADPTDPEKSDFPHGGHPSQAAGRTFTIDKEQYLKLIQPKSAAPPGGGMPGMGGMPPGLPPGM